MVLDIKKMDEHSDKLSAIQETYIDNMEDRSELKYQL